MLECASLCVHVDKCNTQTLMLRQRSILKWEVDQNIKILSRSHQRIPLPTCSISLSACLSLSLYASLSLSLSLSISLSLPSSLTLMVLSPLDPLSYARAPLYFRSSHNSSPRANCSFITVAFIKSRVSSQACQTAMVYCKSFADFECDDS